MTRTRTRRAAPVTRRRFLGTALMGTAAALAAAVPGVAATRRKAKPAAKPAAQRAPKLEAEITKQKGYLAKSLDTIRAHELPPGSEQAFVFSAVKAKLRRGGSR